MTIRQHNLGSIVKPGFNPLGVQTVTTTYFNYLYTWGKNNLGQLGTNNVTYYSSPKQIGALTTWSKISSGREFSLAIKTDQTLWSWGSNAQGQLGLNVSLAANYSSPKQVGSLATWSTIAAGYYHSLAIKTDGTLWSWGAGANGQLGLSNTTRYSSPKQVGALTTWLSVAGGGYFTLAVKTDNTLWAWGENNVYGQLGLNNVTDYNSPKQVGALTTWAYAKCGQAYSAVIKTDGTLWTWGRNSQGQLGLGTSNTYIGVSSPNQVGALTTWKQVSASSQSTLAVSTTGRLWSWGLNGSGVLGLGDTTSRSSPVQVGSLTTWSNVSVSNLGTSAVTTSNTLFVWGRNQLGQLGLGNTTYYSSPKQVGALSTWVKTSGGDDFMIALLY